MYANNAFKQGLIRDIIDNSVADTERFILRVGESTPVAGASCKEVYLLIVLACNEADLKRFSGNLLETCSSDIAGETYSRVMRNKS